MLNVYCSPHIALSPTSSSKHFTRCTPPSYSTAKPTFKALHTLPTSNSSFSNMCGRAYYIDGIRYFGSYPRGHVRNTPTPLTRAIANTTQPLTIRPENYGRRMVVASPSPQIKREETPAMKRESSPPPEPKVKTEPSSPSPPPAPVSL